MPTLGKAIGRLPASEAPRHYHPHCAEHFQPARLDLGNNVVQPDEASPSFCRETERFETDAAAAEAQRRRQQAEHRQDCRDSLCCERLAREQLLKQKQEEDSKSRSNATAKANISGAKYDIISLHNAKEASPPAAHHSSYKPPPRAWNIISGHPQSGHERVQDGQQCQDLATPAARWVIKRLRPDPDLTQEETLIKLTGKSSCIVEGFRVPWFFSTVKTQNLAYYMQVELFEYPEKSYPHNPPSERLQLSSYAQRDLATLLSLEEISCRGEAIWLSWA
ncbi:hypothetical protein WJX73_000890 [Symbiochloris irregularis]|uniref:Uncharacterized protein n=1 Tax=Symbiochloris irregularis TaxID=706552 RepID=A0AAW1P1J4_9CHLO